MPDDEKKPEGGEAKIEISVSVYRSLILDRLRAQIAAKQVTAHEQIAAKQAEVNEQIAEKQKVFELAQSLDPDRLAELFVDMPYWEMPYYEMPHWVMPYWEMPHWSSVGR